MTTLHDAARKALDALTVIGMNYAISSKHWPQADTTIAALREALAAPQPDDSYQDRWFYAKADAVKCIRALEVRHE